VCGVRVHDRPERGPLADMFKVNLGEATLSSFKVKFIHST